METLLQDILSYINRLNTENIIDIGLVTAVLYSILRLLRNTRAIQMLRGLLFVILGLILLSDLGELLLGLGLDLVGLGWGRRIRHLPISGQSGHEVTQNCSQLNAGGQRSR